MKNLETETIDVKLTVKQPSNPENQQEAKEPELPAQWRVQALFPGHTSQASWLQDSGYNIQNTAYKHTGIQH